MSEDRHDFTDPARLIKDLRDELAAATAALDRVRTELALGGHPAPGWIPMTIEHQREPIGLPPVGVLVDLWKAGPYPRRICNVKMEWVPCEGCCDDPDSTVHPLFLDDMGDDVLEGDEATHWRPAPLPPLLLLTQGDPHVQA